VNWDLADQGEVLLLSPRFLANLRPAVAKVYIVTFAPMTTAGRLSCHRRQAVSERLRPVDCLFELRSGFRAKLPSAIKQHLCFAHVADDLNKPILGCPGRMDYDAILEKGICRRQLIQESIVVFRRHINENLHAYKATLEKLKRQMAKQRPSVNPAPSCSPLVFSLFSARCG